MQRCVNAARRNNKNNSFQTKRHIKSWATGQLKKSKCFFFFNLRNRQWTNTAGGMQDNVREGTHMLKATT